MNTKFLNGDELPKSGMIVEILRYDNERFYSPKSKTEEDHIMLVFKGVSKPMILTNRKAKQIERVLKTPMMKEWIGKTILIYSVEEKHFGEFFKVINIKEAIAPPKEKLVPESPKWASALAALKEGSTTIDIIKKHYDLSKTNQTKLESDAKGN